MSKLRFLLATVMLVVIALTSAAPVPVAAQEDTATVKLGLFGCGEQILDPPVDFDFESTCTEPIEATAPAHAYPMQDGQQFDPISIPDAPRDDEGRYLLENLSAPGGVEFRGLQPESYDAFRKSINVPLGLRDWDFTIPYEPGEVVELNIYFFHTENSQEKPHNLFITTLGCPEGIDVNSDLAAECQTPVDLPINAIAGAPPHIFADLHYEERDANGAYHLNFNTKEGALSHLEREDYGSIAWDDGGSGYVTEGVDSEDGGLGLGLRAPSMDDEIHLTLYYLDPVDGAGDATAPADDDPATQTPVDYPIQGTVNLTLHSCPEGVDPREVDPFAECDTIIQANGASAHTGHRGLSTNLDNFLQADGTYQIPAMAEEGDTATVTFLGLEPGSHDDNLIIGATSRTSHGEFEVDVPNGETVNVDVFYYHYD